MKELVIDNQRVLMRVDFNVPLNENHEITDDTRIQKALPSIQYLLRNGASVILMSHLGRPQKKRKENGEIDVDRFSLKYLVPRLKELLNTEVYFSPDCVGHEAVHAASLLKPGEVLLLENTRFYKEEAKGDTDFAKKLSELGSLYVNDAFGTAHRAHASTATIAKYFPKNKKAFGFLIQGEIENADKVIKSPKRPVTAIIGGAKVSDKIKLLERLLDFVDNIIIGGGMAYTFIAAQGGKIGKSLCEKDYLDLATDILRAARKKDVDIHLPVDTVIADQFDNNANRKVVDIDDIPDEWMGLDIGPDSIFKFLKVVSKSKTIMWNGPLGVFEFENFSAGTNEIAKAIGNATENGAFSLIGGGDSVAAINQMGYTDKVSFISTGGGAMLKYLDGSVLPGIQAILEE